jgi:uncharacterized protein (DUF427 family)
MESVWDYPRPPRVEASQKLVRVEFAGEVIAETTRAHRVLETSHPPVYYIPLEDVRVEFLRPSRRHTYCEFKGAASYYDLVVGDREVRDVAWYYPEPTERFEVIRDYVAFYPGRVDAAWVGDEQVTPQEGDFYGGWITSEIAGPFKGAPGTAGW